MSKKHFHVLSILLLILLSACAREEGQPTIAPPEPVTTEPPPAPAGVTAGTISMGKAVGPDKKISTPSETFGKGDTIYASVDTTGSGTAILSAKWTYMKDGQTTVVEEQTQTITGPATTEFHISKPGGWPAGDYQVEIMVDGKSAGVKNFKVA